tara:strand:- start:2187 stop:2402 length:216 start_codon:yes stop_codon:yes gene_type:complete
LKPGDYVEILPGVHDDSMPEERRGLVIEMVKQHEWNTPNKLGLPDQLNVMFHNGKILKFHKSQVKMISKPD